MKEKIDIAKTKLAFFSGLVGGVVYILKTAADYFFQHNIDETTFYFLLLLFLFVGFYGIIGAVVNLFKLSWYEKEL